MDRWTDKIEDRLNSDLLVTHNRKAMATQQGYAKEQARSGVLEFVLIESEHGWDEEKKQLTEEGTILSRSTRSNSASFYSNTRIIFSISHILTVAT